MKRILLLFSIFSCAAILLLSPSETDAHQSRIIEDGKLVVVESPEVSKAYYAELKGKPDMYRIESDQLFRFYLNILAPDIEGATKDYTVKVTREKMEPTGAVNYDLYYLGSSKAPWVPYYEEFAGDGFFKGPEIRSDLEAGTYNIEISSPDNAGKYVLAIGEREEFPLSEVILTIKTLPKLKKDYFGRSPLTAYFNLIGLFLLISLVLLLTIAIGTWLMVRKIRKSRSKEDAF